MANPEPMGAFDGGRDEYELTSANTMIVDAVAVGLGNAELSSHATPGSRPMLALWVRAATMSITEDEPGNPASAIMTLRPTELNLAMPWWMMADLGAMIKVAYTRMPVDIRDQWDARRAVTVREYDRAMGRLVFRNGGWVPE